MRGFWRNVGLKLSGAALLGALVALAFAPTADAGKFKVLHSFCGSPKGGCNPAGGLTMDSSGNLFGTTLIGGATFEGNAYELRRTDTGKLKYHQIYSFCKGEVCTDGRAPTGNLIIDTQGNLYGVGGGGSNANEGVVFELSPPSDGGTKWTEKVLHFFCSQQNCQDGAEPFGGLTYSGAASGLPYDGTSPLFGTTGGGGGQGRGVAFELTNNSGQWTESVLYTFCSQGKPVCADGSGPSGGLLMDQVGNLFGVTAGGGSNEFRDSDGNGVVFQLTPNGDNKWVEKVLWRFCLERGCKDGARPFGELVADGVGDLYGTTTFGGGSCPPDPNDGCGVVFKITPNGGETQESILYRFCKRTDCSDGAFPETGMTVDAADDLIGTTLHGGGNDADQNALGGGTIFRLSGTSHKVLYSFCTLSNCADGEYPNTRPILDASGSIYGTTAYGGAFGGDLLGGVTYRLKQ